ncbi:GNAT family N-acetyltransferase [Modestobacter sp. VKM Ac-2986]|uniref:GNAT family N-acetyltransferase n=1 Tax=Modestobacter sp. VKM Ac-2986 TaxID=3004140 RepID=UPI0022AACCFF|nr:GNAT family N-acetyltransferase [Modestobacter sp. VKM Ac-2986]MCZ2827531.1 GNAT family N-acetyltransferase [Modestobacter sp. VKM Ac-2986]
MTVVVRELTRDELVPAWEMGRLAFGGAAEPPPQTMRVVPGVSRLGAFDERGRLLGKIVELPHEHWWGGRRVPAAGVSGVAVAPESRGGGLTRELLGAVLAQARDRGAAVSTLYPTVSAVYRSAGWEVGGMLRAADLDTASLPRPRDDEGVALRPGDADDSPAVTDLYERLARERDGLLTRRGGFFDEPPAQAPDAVTLAYEDGVLTGALVLDRGRGYGPDARLDVRQLLAVTPAAARALVGVLAGWRTVARTVRVPLLAGDAVSAVLPLERVTDPGTTAWMLRPVDVVRAVEARGWPAHVRGRVAFRLTDALAPWNTGDWELGIEGGEGTLVPARGEPDLVLDVRGFAVLYCGGTSGRAVAQAGLAGGPGDPAALDLLASGPAAQLLDYF